MLAVIAVGPAIEGSFLHRGQIVRNQIGPDLISLVDDGPEFAGLGLPLQAGWIAHAAGVDAVGARCPVNLPDSGSLILRQNSIFGDVAVRPDADVKFGAIWT